MHPTLKAVLRPPYHWALRARRRIKAAVTPSMEAWVRYRPLSHTTGSAAVSPEPGRHDDAVLNARIARAYRAALADFAPDESFWTTEFGKLKAPHHEVLLGGDDAAVAELLRHPTRTLMHYGFDELCTPKDRPPHSISRIIAEHGWLYDGLRRLAEAIGVYPLAYPEGFAFGDFRDPRPEVEALLRLLDGAFGFRVEFPNPFGGERGLGTSRGIASYRAIQGLYQAWRIHELTRAKTGRSVLEIGAGLGRTAYYAAKFGIERYTIVDIPLTGVAQASFLGRTLGPDAIRLLGEEPGAAVSILPPSGFLQGDERYDLVMNVDSFTEMDRSTAESYWRAARGRTSILLSINHEANRFTVRDLYRNTGLDVTRHPYWLRRGYVEELVRVG